MCMSCHQACLRINAAAEEWLARRDAGLLTNSAQRAFLNAMPQRRCSTARWKEPSGVHRGCFSSCYRRAPATPPKPRVICASRIHDRVSRNKAPTAHPSRGIMPFLWSGEKGTEQAGLFRLSHAKVCPACRTLVEKRNRAEVSSVGPLASPMPRALTAGGQAAPQGRDVDLSLAREDGHVLILSAAAEPALCAATGSPAAPAAGETGCGTGRAPDAVRDGAPATVAATVANEQVTNVSPSGGAGFEARAPRPSVYLAIATVLAVCSCLDKI